MPKYNFTFTIDQQIDVDTIISMESDFEAVLRDHLDNDEYGPLYQIGLEEDTEGN